MTPTPDETPRVSSRPPDQRYREYGLELILRLAALIRVGRAYQVGNQVFTQQMESFVQTLQKVLTDSEEAVLVALDTDLYLNGFRIPIRPANLRFHQAVLEEFKRRKIAGLRVERGLEGPEVERFFELFMQPDAWTGTGLLEQSLVAGINHILPAVHASSFAPDAPLDDLGSWNGIDDEPVDDNGPDAGHFPAAATLSGGLDQRAHGKAPRGAARKSYYLAMSATKSLLAPTSLHQGLEMRHAKRVVQPLVDGAFEDEPVIVGLSTLGHHDEFTYAHAVNVTQVAVTMGRALGLDRRSLADLGVAALLHDVGKQAVADRIQHPLDEFTEEERAACEQHPVEGVKLLARSTALNSSTLRCMRASLEHHLTLTGRGYPALEGWQPSVLSQIIGVADCYVCLQTYRSRHGANVTPHQALGMVLGPMRKAFEPVLLWALVQAVGLYPPGQLVELDDGRIALVLAPNAEALERPHVRIIARTDRRRLMPEERVEYRPLPAGMEIRRALKAEDYPEDPTPEDGEAPGAADAA